MSGYYPEELYPFVTELGKYGITATVVKPSGETCTVRVQKRPTSITLSSAAPGGFPLEVGYEVRFDTIRYVITSVEYIIPSNPSTIERLIRCELEQLP